MKFLISRASLADYDCPHSKAVKDIIRFRAKDGEILELYIWTIELNSLSELLEFIKNIPQDPNHPDFAWSEQSIILEKSFEWDVIEEDREKYPEWEIKIYDYWVE